MIAIIDYKTGNIASLTAALKRLGQVYVVTNDPAVIQKADRVILPGVGRAKPAMAELRRLGLDQVIKELKVPVLGICLGMQLLAEWSEEDDTACLGCLPANVKRFQSTTLSIPHIGWNTVQQVKPDPLYNQVPNNSYMYFVHSYYMDTGEWTVGSTQYSQLATAVTRWNNFVGVQFHPEKSGTAGLRLLKNFCTDGFQKWWAIDVLDGKCVRLQQGDFTAVTEYSSDPVITARQLVEQGADGIHVVDLNAAKTGELVNQSVIREIIAAVSVPVQVGGGIRSVAAAENYLNLGVKRVVIGTAALTNSDLLKKLVQQFGNEKIIVGLDIKNGKPVIRGWQSPVDVSVEQAITRFTQAGIQTLIVTDVSTDGMLTGPNLDLIQKVIQQDVMVIVSGGIANLNDIERCRNVGAIGAVVGKAVYEGKLSPLTKRVIPCMDIANGRVVKGTHFTELKDAGDPVALARIYSEQGADELVLLDITATVEQRDTLYDLVKHVADSITIPFTVGGGVRTVDDIRALLNAGADKVSIGSAAVENPEFVAEAAQQFGSQCIVISVDPKWNQEKQAWEIYTKGGRENSGINALDFVQQMEKLGAGELLVNSLDRDGTQSGYDIPLLRAIRAVVRIPIIASSGVGTPEHFAEAFQIANVDAVLAASVFHSDALRLPEVKSYLAQRDIPIRL